MGLGGEHGREWVLLTVEVQQSSSSCPCKSSKPRAEAGGFLEEICEWSQLIIIVELSSVGEHPQIHEKKVLH